MTTYPEDPKYLKDHKPELDYIDRSAGPWTFFNIVGKPVHADEAYKALAAGIQSAQEIYIVSWFMHADAELLREGWDKPIVDPARQDIRLGSLVLAAAKRGARISIILWDFLHVSIPSALELATADSLDKLGELPPTDLPVHTEGSANPIMMKVFKLRDDLRKINLRNQIVVVQHPTSMAGSHHQKFWLFRDDTRLSGLVGGVNLHQHDWDDATHEVLNPRRNPQAMEGKDRAARLAKGDLPRYDPRHDWMMKVEGHAALALLEEFHARWAQSTLAPPTPLPAPKDIMAPGAQFVQISRTWPKDPAPGQILKAYTRAFEKASKYIYIENQYWTNDELTGVLDTQLSNRSSLKIIIVLPFKMEDIGASWIVAEQNYQLSRLIAKYGIDRVLVYQLFRKHPTRPEYINIYVHAKLAIVDDCWLTVGSANTNNRSMWLDSECNAQLANRDLVTQIRKSLWSHLLGGPEGDASEPELAIEQGWRKIGVKNEQARHDNEPLRGFILPNRLDGSSAKRPPEKLRKYL